MATCSEYLRRPPRTLKQACRDISVARSESGGPDCGRCANRRLCEIDESCVLARRQELAVDAKDAARSSVASCDNTFR
jgi:hypothetical protein